MPAIPTASHQSFTLRALRGGTPLFKLGAVLAGTLILAISSHIKVPMYPVPMTLQTLAVPLIGALYGWRLGAITVLTWLMQAALGAPVLAGPATGIGYFVGPTAGYLFAFPIAAALAGSLAERGWDGRYVTLAFVGMLLANLICLLVGATWLALLIGVERALTLGVTPFLVGGLVKSALGAAILGALARVGSR